MAWIKIESSVSRNRKFVQAGPAASWLWVCGLAYCQEGLTDGFIPSEALDFLGVKHARRLSLHLVQAHLWEAVEGGWRVHDYLGHNRDAATVRALQHDRREAGATGGRASGEVRRTKQTVEATAKQNGKPDRSKPEATREPSTATATDQISNRTDGARARGAPLHDTSHRKHAACGRVCVPADLHNEFTRRRNTPDADNELRAWYLAVDTDWADGGPKAHVETGDTYDFWRARYAEHWPTPHAKAGKWDAWQPAGKV